MITIVDYGVGNLGSLKNMFNKIGATSEISSDFDNISAASKLLLPGVGSFDHCMKNLQESGLAEILAKKVLEDKIPILGICVGFQLMFTESEEGKMPGLGWIKGKVLKFKISKDYQDLRIPHMGWNTIKCNRKNSLFNFKDNEEMRFYFAHSYYAHCENEDDIIFYTTHGHNFISGIEKENIIAVQFHPEKSHKFGMNLLKKYSEI